MPTTEHGGVARFLLVAFSALVVFLAVGVAIYRGAGPFPDPEGCVAAGRNRGRGRIELQASVPLPDGGVATVMQARYVAIARR